jgi:hypothetical protein
VTEQCIKKSVSPYLDAGEFNFDHHILREILASQGKVQRKVIRIQGVIRVCKL